jgi:hypothetical protein
LQPLDVVILARSNSIAASLDAKRDNLRQYHIQDMLGRQVFPDARDIVGQPVIDEAINDQGLGLSLSVGHRMECGCELRKHSDFSDRVDAQNACPIKELEIADVRVKRRWKRARDEAWGHRRDNICVVNEAEVAELVSFREREITDSGLTERMGLKCSECWW